VLATADRYRFAPRWKNDLHQLAKQELAANGRSSSYRGTDLYHSVTGKKRLLAESTTIPAQACRASGLLPVWMLGWRVAVYGRSRQGHTPMSMQPVPERGDIDIYNLNVIFRK
jgi:hypothetical protein